MRSFRRNNPALENARPDWWGRIAEPSAGMAVGIKRARGFHCKGMDVESNGPAAIVQGMVGGFFWDIRRRVSYS